MQALFEN